MRPTFSLGRFAGVPVGVNWSVLLIFGLITWGLAAVQFPRAYPGESWWAYALAGFTAAVVFFLGLLAHEVSHSVVARRNGLPVRGITLWLFGGVSELGGEARSPGAELADPGARPGGLLGAQLRQPPLEGRVVGDGPVGRHVGHVVGRHRRSLASPLPGGPRSPVG